MSAQAWVFAGHGSQYPGMGRGFAFDAPAVRAVFAVGERASGLPLRDLSQRGGAEQLVCPTLLEPLLVAFSLSYAALLTARGHSPRAVAGYSAGMLPALVCAGVLDMESAFALAVRRGAVLAVLARVCEGAMIAVRGLPAAHTIALLQAIPQGAEVDVAGWNSTHHLTLAGTREALRPVATALAAAGARVFDVPVAGAWHSRCAAGLAPRFRGLTDDLHFHAPRLPIYSSVSARREDDPQRLRDHLATQIEAPVYWQATLASLSAGERVGELLEVGCGRTLAGLQVAASRHSTSSLTFSNLYHHLRADHDHAENHHVA